MSSQPSPIQPDDYWQLRFLQDAALSPDGSQVVYTVSHTVVEEPGDDADSRSAATIKEYKTIHLLDLHSNADRALTPGNRQDHSPIWSPDGRHIAFVSNRAENPQIFVMPIDGGEARQLTELEQGVGGGLAWSPDGSTIAFTAGSPQPSNQSAPYRVTRPLWRFDAVNHTDRNNQNVWLVDVASGAARQLSDDGWHHTQPRWSPHGHSLLTVASLGPDSFDFTGELRQIQLDGTVEPLAPGWGSVAAAEWSLDGSQIFFAGSPDEAPAGAQHKLWRVAGDRDAVDPPLCLTDQLDLHVAGGLQPDFPAGTLRLPRLATGDDGSVFVKVQERGTVPIYKFGVQGNAAEAVVGGDRSCELLGLIGNTVLFAASDINHPPDLYAIDLKSGSERQLTHLNDDLLANRSWPQVQQLIFSGQDGVEVEGWLLLPANGESPHPGFLYIHGGPHGAFGHTFHWDMQMLAGAGYGVLLINHRASTGYGDAFSTAITGAWGGLDYTDLMAGVDYAIEQGFLDPDRLALGGLSGGGNLTCWIVGQTNRFKAAIPENPVTNFVSFYGVSDIGVEFASRELGGHLHEIPEVYRRCSPITYAHNCTTPTLLVQGESDWRCPAEQSEQFYTVLRANGCHAEMLRLPGSAHAGAIVGNVAVRQAQNEALLDWVQRYVPI